MIECATQSCDVSVQPYTGIRILDLTHQYGSYAGKLFADLGAETILIEPPGGSPDRQREADENSLAPARFAFLNSGKKSVVIDPKSAADRGALERLVTTSAIVFVEKGGNFYGDIAWLRRTNPSAVITVISPFGMTGPLADAPASDLVVQAAGGIAWMSGRIEDAPLSLPYEQATMVTSIYAATVTAIALVDSEATGQGHLIDVSAQECFAHSLQNALQVYDLEQRVSIRGGEGTRDASEDIFPCKDGFVFLAAPLALGTSWKSLVAFIREKGHPVADALSNEKWSNREWRLTGEARDELRLLFTTFTKDFTKAELTREAISRRIVLGPVNRVSDVFDDIQLAYRSFFVDMRKADGGTSKFPGAPYRLTPQVWKTSPAPALGDGSLHKEEKP